MVRTSKSAAEVRRAQAILLTDVRGGSRDLKRLTGYSRSHALLLKQRYRDEGQGALADKRQGKPKELLTKKQRDALEKALKEKKPRDVGYASEFWTSGTLGAWIKKKYGVTYKSKTSLYLIFKKVSFTYHRPATVYKERDEAEVAAWRTKAKKRLTRALSEKDTIILAGDEMILTTATTIQKVWLPKGEYPKIEVKTGTRLRRNIYGFLNLTTGREHAFKTEFQNMHVSADILRQLRNLYPGKKILLFWDNAGWHKGSAAQEQARRDGNLEIFWFPRYAPDEDPQEKVWKAGRSAVTHNAYIADIDIATDKLVDYFNTTTFPYSFLGKCLVS